MSGIRQSVITASEDTFGEGRGGNAWQAPPPGTYFGFTHTRNVSKVQAEGTKTFDTFSFGTVAGSWEWSFTLDYDYMHPLLYVFEDHSVSGSAGTFTHTFAKANNKRVPSFTARVKVLNEMADGPAGSDEVIELRGCVCKSISFSMSAGSSAVSVNMSGFYVDEKMYKGSIGMTDYQPYNGDLVEFSCLFIGDPECGNYVANTDSLSLSIDNSAQAVYSTCTPFAANFAEGVTQYQFSTTCYSNNPSYYKQRVYSGGYNNTFLYPQSKNLAPIPKLSVASYSLAMKDGYGDTVQDCIAESPKTAIFTLENTVIKSIAHAKGDGSKLQDQISSTDAQRITLTVKNGQSDLACHDVVSTPANV